MKKNILYKLSVLAILAVTFTGCLNDSLYDNGTTQAVKNTGNQNFVEIHLTSSDNSNIVSRAYPVIGRDTTITQFIPVTLTSGPATSDVTVTYTLLDASNSTVMDSLVNIDGLILDQSKLTVLNEGSKIVIPKGSSTAYLSIKLNPNNLIGDNYVFGIRITAVSDPKYTISNLTDGIVKIGAANNYDGEYKVTGTFFDAGNSLFTGRYPMDVYLITQGVLSNAMFDLKIGDYAHSFLNASSASYYGSFSPVFKFDPSSNKIVSVTNYYGQPAANGRSAEIDPDGINAYDPVTKTIKVSYWMNQPTVVTPHRTHFVEVYTYIGAR